MHDFMEKPRLRHCTMLDAGQDRPLRLIVGENHYELTELVGSRATFLKLKSLLDGRHDVRQIAERTGLRERDVLNVVEALDGLGLLRREVHRTLIPVQEFLDKLAATTLMWRRQIGFHPLFQGLASGRYRKEVLQGLFIETYHAVRLCSTHIATAIAHTDSDFRRETLSRYFSEEFSHSPLILKTCKNLGCVTDEVEDSHPIVATRSLIQMLCDIARSDTIGYAAALTLFEAQPNDEIEGKESLNLIAEAYNIQVSAFFPALKHLRDDIHGGHYSLLNKILGDQDSISEARVHSIINNLHDLKHAYDQFHDGIISYYSDLSNYVPRLKVDYFSL